MFPPYLRILTVAFVMSAVAAPVAIAQVQVIVVTGAMVAPAPATPSVIAPDHSLLAEVSAAAGIPFIPAAATQSDVAGSEPVTPPLCIRAGVGLSIPALNTPVMTMEHGIVGCPTETAGLPFVLTKDPALQTPLNARTGDYNLDVTVRYRLLQHRHLELLANASAQAIGYSLNEPVSGNNVMLSVSLIF